jgi:calcium binding protein 39
MAFLFGGRGRQKSPAEIAKALKELLHKLWEPTINPKVEEEAAKYMAQMKLIVQGTPGEMSRQNTSKEVVLMAWFRGGLQP